MGTQLHTEENSNTSVLASRFRPSVRMILLLHVENFCLLHNFQSCLEVSDDVLYVLNANRNLGNQVQKRINCGA